jgi:hypothetical protein
LQCTFRQTGACTGNRQARSGSPARNRPASPLPLQFTSGYWDVDEYDEHLKETLGSYPKRVELLAFAPGGGYYVLWEDGAQTWRGIPTSLHNRLNGRQKSLPGVEFLSIGPSGEWFVRFLDGSWRTRDVEPECREAVQELKDGGREVLKVLFGHDGSWMILSDN